MKKLLDFFSSVKLAMFLFILIAAASSTGSLISRGDAGSKTVLWLAEKFGTSHDAMFAVLTKTGFADVYSSWWFIALLVLFGINLTVCTFHRLPYVYKQLKTPVTVNKNIFETSQTTVNFDADDTAYDKVLRFLVGYSAVEERDGETIYIAAEKGRFSRSGVYITHLGIMVILIAALFAIVTGYEGNMAVMEGNKDNVIVFKDKKTKKLPFSIQLNDFEVEYYKDTAKAKSYKSDITIIDKDTKHNETLMVNQPIRYNGYRIYQVNHGFYPSKDAMFLLTSSRNNEKVNSSVKFGEKFSIPGTDLSAEVMDFAPSLGQDAQGKLVNFNTLMMNPAVYVNIYDGNGTPLGGKWIFKNFPESGDVKEFKIVFNDIRGAQYSIFSVSREPGGFLVYLGFIILSIGVIIAFYFRHERVWVRISSEEGRVSVSAAADRSKFRTGIAEMLEKLKQSVIKAG